VHQKSKKRERSKKRKSISKAKKQEQIIIKQELNTMKDIILRYLDIQHHKKNNGPAHIEQESRLFNYAKDKLQKLKHHKQIFGEKRHNSAPRRRE
jgi:hypothetical protein